MEWHSTWQEQVFIGVFYGLAAGFYYAASPNPPIDSVPTDRQGVSAGMFGVFGSIGTSVGSAIFTAIVAAHPFQIVANEAGHAVVSNVPSTPTPPTA
jgi:MFS family permease